MFLILKAVADWAIQESDRNDISLEYREALLALAKGAVAVMRFR